jgi:predicted DNA binding protein
MAESPLILELEQVHRCVSRETSEKVAGAKIRWLATLSMDERAVTNLFETDSASILKVLEKARSLRDVKSARLVQKGLQNSWITMTADRKVSSAPKLAEAGVIWLQPACSEDGVDRVTMFAPSFSNFRKFLELVEGDYDIKVRSKRFISQNEKISFDMFSSNGFLHLRAAAELLTPRQFELFDLACRHGYYQEPKKISLQDLGARLGISESTSAELLRKAEGKLMPMISEVLRTMV